MTGQTCFVTMFKWIYLYVITVSVFAAGAAQNGPSGCVLPPYPPHGTYTVYDKPKAVPGQTYAFAILTVSCDPEYAVIGNNGTYCFGRNIWLHPLPQCTRFCRLTPDPSVIYSCKVTGDDILSGTRRCREWEPDGTVVVPECNRPVYYSSVDLPNMRCVRGTWDITAVCQPDCGTFTPVGEGLIINGTRVKRGELPWHAAIYDNTYTPFMQVCGGSLISTKVIISAAHCFWNDATGRQPASRYAVALGKIYRPWNNDMDPGVHRSHVSEIQIPVRFLGAAGNYQDDIALVVMATPVVYVTYIRPVCMDFNVEFDRNQLRNSNLGRVSGWGLTSADGDASQVLLTTELAYVDVEKCIASLPENFRPLITSDKICAGGNGATVCRGDSGGGLAFPIVDRGIRRHYLRGVVSTAPTSGQKCNTNTYTAFTHILPHATFIKGLDVVSVHDGITKMCVMPQYPEHGTYSVRNQPFAAPGQEYNSAIVNVSCDPGYSIDGASDIYCSNGNWTQNMPRCTRACRLRSHPSVTYICQVEENGLKGSRECKEYERSGTTVIPKCNRHYYYPGVLADMHCINSTWDYVAVCQAGVVMELHPIISENHGGPNHLRRVTFTCKYRAPEPLTIQFYYEGKRINESKHYNTSKLYPDGWRGEHETKLIWDTRHVGEILECHTITSKGFTLGVLVSSIPEPDGDSQVTTTNRPSPPQSTVSVKISSPTIKIENVGGQVNFTCEATSRLTKGTLPVSWSKVDGHLPQGRTFVNRNTGVLLITQVQVSDSGTYICQTSDGISTEQARASLTVGSNPMTVPTVSIQPSVNEYYEGERIELECVTTGNPTPKIIWQRASGQPLPLEVEYYKSYLVIARARVEDSGEYRCIARNTAGSDDRIAAITVRPRPSRPSRERLTVTPSVPNVVEGQSTNIICTGTANLPVGSIGWIRQDGAQLASNVRSDNGVLYIDIARLENQGVYVCQTTSEQAPSMPVLLTVTPLSTPPPGEAPAITVSVDSLKIPTGESGTIDCNPQGYPTPYIKWSKHSGNFGPGTSQRGNTLTISNAQDEDKGYYMCTGTVDGTPVANTYVMVEIETRIPPKVEIWPPGEQAVPLGGEFELHCQVLGGVPPPEILWSRSRERPLSPSTHLQPQAVLKFDRIEVNDEGEYICTATNLAGQASANATLKVRSDPEITLTPGSLVEANPGERVDVHCRANGYPEPLVSIKLRTDLREIVPASPGIASLHIDAASERDDGDYVCTAVSAAGTVEEQFTVRVERGDGGFGSYECGTPNLGGSVGGSELPWTAVIYKQSVSSYDPICAGSLVSTTHVITVADCFWKTGPTPEEPHIFAVSLGSIYRSSIDVGDSSRQNFNVSDIKYPPKYNGDDDVHEANIALVMLSTPAVYNNYVKPVCIDFDHNFDQSQLRSGNLGEIMGLDVASQKMVVLKLPIVDFEICFKYVAINIRHVLTSDKICAGPIINKPGSCNASVLGGSGVSFRLVERGTERYYLRGVTATVLSAGASASVCNVFFGLTHVQKHQAFITKYLRSNN